MVRTAKIKCKSGVIIRPVKRLYLLEIREEDNLFEEKNVPKTSTETTVEDESSVSDSTQPSLTTRTGRVIRHPERYAAG